jgi:hypothetical protein
MRTKASVPGARLGCDGAGLVLADDMLAAAQVQHRDLVAEPVHLQEPAIGQSVHLVTRPMNSGSMAEAT